MKKFIVALALLLGVLSVSAPAHAASPSTIMAADCGSGIANFLGFKSWDACLPKDSNGVPQITALNDIWLIAFPVLEDFIKAAGYAAVGFVIWGGIKYIKSQGDPGQLTEARQVLYNALMGLVICLLSVAIVQVVARAL